MTYEKPLILVVEDESAIAMMLAEWFIEEGYEACIAYDGAQALAMLTTVVPAAITLDLSMPVMSGFELLPRIRQNPATRHVPVVILSAVPELANEVLRLAEGFFPKPFSPRQVMEYLQLFIGPPDGERSA
jgi:CheY-like chemotaxis protein